MTMTLMVLVSERIQVVDTLSVTERNKKLSDLQFKIVFSANIKQTVKAIEERKRFINRINRDLICIEKLPL